jgi:hypothetical protein
VLHVGEHRFCLLYECDEQPLLDLLVHGGTLALFRQKPTVQHPTTIL